MKIEVEMSSRDPCKVCKGVAVAQFDVWKAGYSAGSGYRHTADCTTLFCGHGTLHRDECLGCEIDFEDAYEGEE